MKEHMKIKGFLKQITHLSALCVIFLTFSFLLTACGKTSSAAKPDDAPAKPRNELLGAWRALDSPDDILFFFYENNQFEGFDCDGEQVFLGTYTVSGNKLTLKDTIEDEDPFTGSYTINSNTLSMTSSDVTMRFTRVGSPTDKGTDIFGRWKPVFTSCRNLPKNQGYLDHLFFCGYPLDYVEFYEDSTAKLHTTDNNIEHAQYSLIHDATAIEMFVDGTLFSDGIFNIDLHKFGIIFLTDEDGDTIILHSDD